MHLSSPIKASEASFSNTIFCCHTTSIHKTKDSLPSPYIAILPTLKAWSLLYFWLTYKHIHHSEVFCYLFHDCKIILPFSDATLTTTKEKSNFPYIQVNMVSYFSYNETNKRHSTWQRHEGWTMCSVFGFQSLRSLFLLMLRTPSLCVAFLLTSACLKGWRNSLQRLKARLLLLLMTEWWQKRWLTYFELHCSPDLPLDQVWHIALITFFVLTT
jgi:hypothetical protein